MDRSKLADNQIITEALQSGETCFVCHKALVATMPLRAICTAMLISRGTRTDPRILRKNYVRGAVVCCEECETAACALPAIVKPNLANMAMALATRIIMEDRAPEERCEIVAFSSMGLSEFIDNVIIVEMLARMEIIQAQMHAVNNGTTADTHDQVSQAVRTLQNLVDNYFHDQDFADHCETVEFESPFAPGSASGALFDKCLSVFAIFATDDQDTDRSSNATTIFEDAIIQQIGAQFQMRATLVRDLSPVEAVASGHTRVVFPVQIRPSVPRSGANNAKGKKTVVLVSSVCPAKYELAR